MSEEILKALMELFALIVKQDGGILINEREYVSDFLNKQLTKEAVDEYLSLFNEHAGPLMERSSVTLQYWFLALKMKGAIYVKGCCQATVTLK